MQLRQAEGAVSGAGSRCSIFPRRVVENISVVILPKNRSGKGASKSPIDESTDRAKAGV